MLTSKMYLIRICLLNNLINWDFPEAFRDSRNIIYQIDSSDSPFLRRYGQVICARPMLKSYLNIKCRVWCQISNFGSSWVAERRRSSDKSTLKLNQKWPEILNLTPDPKFFIQFFYSVSLIILSYNLAELDQSVIFDF